MLKGITSDLTGSADICKPVRDFEKCLAYHYLLPSESIVFSLQSTKEEFTFTSQALLKITGESATTTRKLVERFDYKSHEISSVQFETAGRVDRDCEIKFHIGGTHMSIDIATSEQDEAIIYYKTLALLGREQRGNGTKWQLTTTALGHAASALRLRDGLLTKQADDAAAWLQDKYKSQQPRCYRDFLLTTMQQLRTNDKLAR